MKKKKQQKSSAKKNSFGKELTSTNKKALRQYKSLGYVIVIFFFSTQSTNVWIYDIKVMQLVHLLTS